MPQPHGVSRFVRRLAEAPWLITETHRAVFASAEELRALEERIANMEATVQAQLEASSLLTRAVHELNDRLEELARHNEPSSR